MAKFPPFETNEEIHAFSNAYSTGTSKEIMKIIGRLRDASRKKVETAPALSDSIPEDVRYHLGRLAAFNQILDLHEKAKGIVEKGGSR